MKAVLGIDTSCYTTSAALVSVSGRLIASSRRLLTVEDGERGLMQSQGLFQHVRNLPEMIEDVMNKAQDVQIAAICASTRPRPAEDSYMPVFRAGESQARAAAALLRVPFYPASHQEGHVRAAMVDSGIESGAPFLALHLSGGTTEILLADRGELTLLGGSLDLHAGQLVDRTGVYMHLPFPAGPSLERLAKSGIAQAPAKGLLGVSIKGVDCNMAGAENKIVKWLNEGKMSHEEIAVEVFDFLCRTIERMIENACEQTGARQALLAGGVASSTLLRDMLIKRAKKRRLDCRLCFARPELSGDNAVGVALLGAQMLRQARENAEEHKQEDHDGCDNH
ncbi:MAG: O-sialoglycoprotein endopeptidase [Clostridia bacterium]|nr:O-sialoglycoprotein endopeptidase [Clostridia bacterium]